MVGHHHTRLGPGFHMTKQVEMDRMSFPNQWGTHRRLMGHQHVDPILDKGVPHRSGLLLRGRVHLIGLQKAHVLCRDMRFHSIEVGKHINDPYVLLPKIVKQRAGHTPRHITTQVSQRPPGILL